MDPEFRFHRDFRSPSVPEQRRRKDTVKYYSYRAVHPSWVGQQYYTIHLVSSTIHTLKIKPKSLQHEAAAVHVTHVTEKDEPALLETLTESRSLWSYFNPWWLPSQVHLAVAQAKVADIDSYPVVVPNTQTTPINSDSLFDIDDPKNPRSIERIPIDPPAPYPDTMPDNLHLKLRLNTWTKKDNYDTKSFYTWGPDRRHHHGKRKVREKHLQKWNDKTLGRGQRQKSQRIKYEVSGYGGPLHDHWMLYDHKPYDEWDDEEDIFTCYFDWISTWRGSGWPDIDGDAWSEDEHYCHDHWSGRIDQEKLIWKIVRWRQERCDYEKMAEFEFEGAVDEEDTISVDSDVVVLERVVDINTDADVDVMSDLAEVIVQEEWDMLSDTSGIH